MAILRCHSLERSRLLTGVIAAYRNNGSWTLWPVDLQADIPISPQRKSGSVWHRARSVPSAILGAHCPRSFTQSGPSIYCCVSLPKRRYSGRRSVHGAGVAASAVSRVDHRSRNQSEETRN
ncbi:hypothetical protein MAPG_00812 [Magnaporthiopsis poae ATCC 64411]|uniref:Uncharacterized protein n=1 Tax=Magnaporthiopsis poae (strain ATCC 64411 / 73-15) TaxID=644358 RepID=A0A0C4DM11_MAGP6|nr:hypothetical protein MAPG_00812 [Magnaporthiopsis poae ATCC 64411]